MFCFYANMIGYCQNLFKRYLSDPVEHVYIVFKFRNLVRKVSLFHLTLSTLKKRRSSADMVTRLEVPSNIVQGVELLGTPVFVAIGTLPTNLTKSEFDRLGQKKNIRISRTRLKICAYFNCKRQLFLYNGTVSKKNDNSHT